jgi:hypothetical protein
MIALNASFLNWSFWFGLYTGVGLILVLLLPFPFVLICVFALCVFINFIRGRRIIKRNGSIDRIEDVSDYVYSRSVDNQRPLRYYCMDCMKEYREIACPNCGSKMKRIG